jgi:hypothetical protein
VSLYHLQKFLYVLNRDETAQDKFKNEPAGALDEYDLSDEERSALERGDIGLLYVLGVNGQILMHFAALLGIEWFDYLDMMRKGIEKHGAVRDGIYAMTGGGDSFTTEEKSR